MARVQLWRSAHPGYWRRAKGERRDRPEAPVALQDLCPAQAIEIAGNAQELLHPALQDLLLDQPAVLIGFIAQFTGSTLQDATPHAAYSIFYAGPETMPNRVRSGIPEARLPRYDSA